MSNSAVVWCLGLLDVREILIPDPASDWSSFQKLLAKALKTVSQSSLFPSTWSLQGCPLLWSLLATIEENVGHLGLIGSASNNEVLLQTSPCRRPMQLACPLHSWGSCLVVCVFPSWLPPWSLVKSATQKIFHFGRVFVVPQVNISLWEGVVVLKWPKLPMDRLMALMRWCLVHSWGGDCTVPPCKTAKGWEPVTDTLDGFENNKKILYFGEGVLGLARARWLNRRTYSGNATCLLWEGGVIVYWEQPWPWQWSEQWLPLQMSRTVTALWPWSWTGSDGSLARSRSDTKHCFPNNKWQIYTKGLLAWTVTDTVAYAFA